MPEPEIESYERRDINPSAVMWAAIWLTVVLAVTFLAMRIFESTLGNGRPAEARALAPQANVPPPRLQTNPVAELSIFRKAEETKLHSYGWADRDAGVIHIPIDRAMELTLKRGLPARSTTKGGAP